MKGLLQKLTGMLSMIFREIKSSKISYKNLPSLNAQEVLYWSETF